MHVYAISHVSGAVDKFSRQVSVRAFGGVALVAVISYWAQLPGLAGSHGIVPMAELLDSLRAELAFVDLPTLLWVSNSDTALHVCCAGAVFAALSLVLGRFFSVAFFSLWAFWLSLVSAGAPFLAFQWDILLLESCLVLCFYAGPPAPTLAGRALVAALCCKITLESGLVKLMSGDPHWRDMTALTYHWWSQPLPSWSSVWLATLPLALQKVLCVFVFLFELLVPVLVLGPRRMRLIGAGGLMLLQLGLFVGGNYSYYNALTAVLCLPLLDDAVWRRAALRRLPKGPWWQWAFVGLFALLSVGAFLRLRNPVLQLVAPFASINAYGAFAVMTTERDEIVLEATEDGETWRPYALPYKPGALSRRPQFVAPWQPRLDWQLWFASLGDCGNNPWVYRLQQRLLDGQPEVLALFDEVPSSTPLAVRSMRWAYRFSSQPGVWWERSNERPYCPAVWRSSRPAP
jgi:lipase maturation factor 1